MKTLIALILLTSSISFAKGKFEVTSNLKNGQAIPEDYYANVFGCTAKNESASLEWKNAPEGTKSFAITFYDKDAPTGSGFWHYLLVDIPASVNKIELGDLSKKKIPAGSLETITDKGDTGFFGPCPPVGRKHTYTYTVHALKVEKLGVKTTDMPAYVGFNLWNQALGTATLKVTAGPRK